MISVLFIILPLSNHLTFILITIPITVLPLQSLKKGFLLGFFTLKLLTPHREASSKAGQLGPNGDATEMYCTEYYNLVILKIYLTVCSRWIVNIF